MAKALMPAENYWDWDSIKWGTHRTNCVAGSCPFRVYMRDGRVLREEISCTLPEFDDPDFRLPDSNPRGCQKGYQHSRSMYGPDRVLYPMKCKGDRGSGQWERISWEQAFEEIGAKLADIIERHEAHRSWATAAPTAPASCAAAARARCRGWSGGWAE